MGLEKKGETNARVVEAEDVAVAIVERRDQRLEIGAVVGELVEDDFRLGFGKGTHRAGVEGLVSWDWSVAGLAVLVSPSQNYRYQR